MNNEHQGNAEDIHCVIEATLEQLFNGADRKVDVQRRLVCDLCHATGTVDYFYKCERCSGSGIEIDNKKTTKHMRLVCRDCGSRGETNRCKQCKGIRFPRECFSVDVHIDQGTCDRDKIVVQGGGHQNLNESFGDLVITIREIEHPIFKRNWIELATTININFTESLCGFKRALKTLDDRQLVLISEPGKVYGNGDTKCLINKGMPMYNDPTRKGNLTIHFQVGEMPNKIARKHVATLERILPAREIPPPGLIDAEDCNMLGIRKLRYIQHPLDQHPHFRKPQYSYAHDNHPHGHYAHDNQQHGNYAHDEYGQDQYPQNEDNAEGYELELNFEIDLDSQPYDHYKGRRSPEF